jgi:ferritin
MADLQSAAGETDITRDRLAELLNEDLAREYQAIIAYVVYSQVLTGAQYMDIAAQLEIHARQELDHALILSWQIDYLGKMPVVTPKPVRTSKDAKECFNSISTMKTRPSAIIATASANARRSENTRSPNRSARSSPRSRITRSISRPRSASTSRT